MVTKIAARMVVSTELLKLSRSRVLSSGTGCARRQEQVNRRWRSPFAGLWLAALLSSLLLFSLGCANPENVTHVAAAQTIQVGSELAPDQVINRQLETDPRTLDPSLSQDVVGFIVLQDLFEGLTTVAMDGSTIPGVAASWETSADGKTWTFHLRKDARWSNGEPVTADDFVYAWRREVDPATASEYSQALAPIENAMEVADGKMPVDKLGVESMGSQTLVVHLHAPTAYLPALLTNAYLFPLYAPTVKQWGDAWTQPGHMVSNGPFVLSDRVLNGHITLLKNSHYWDAAHVHLTRVNYQVVEDNTAAMNQYLAGDLDLTDRFPAPDKDRLEQMLGSQVVLSPNFATAMFSFNVAKQPFINNPKLRVALSAALDRDILSKYVLRGIEPPAYNIMPPLKGYDPVIPDWAKMTTDARHAYARELYQEAGYSDRNPLETVLTVMTQGPEQRRFMEAVVAMWQVNLGAKVQLYFEEWKVFLQAKQQKLPLLYWDAWSGDYPDPFTFMQLFETGNGMNNGSYHNARYDDLIGEASNTNDAAKRLQLFQQAEGILNEDAPTIPVYFYSSTHLIKPYVKGWQPNVMDQILSRYIYILAHQES
jgi:oligopeptide transport system substrate-binding protein